MTEYDGVVMNLKRAIDYYSGALEWCEREGHMDSYQPGNLMVCEKLQLLLQKRSFADADYREIRDTTLSILQTDFHKGVMIWWIIHLIDAWLGSSWIGFKAGSLLEAFKGVLLDAGD